MNRNKKIYYKKKIKESTEDFVDSYSLVYEHAALLNKPICEHTETKNSIENQFIKHQHKH